MADTIFLLDNNKQLTELTEADYLTEDELQTLLADFPKLISGDLIDAGNPRRWLMIKREMAIADSETAGGRWSLDHLFIDQDGIPALIEVKRSTDTRIRREVIGQMLDYAANAVSYWNVNDIREHFESTCSQKGVPADECLLEFLGSEELVLNYWNIVQTNLKASKIRLLLVADTIPREMKRIIEFLNEQMTTCIILGIEIKQFKGQNNFKTLVPKVIGATANAQNQKSAVKNGVGELWTEERFFAEINAKYPDHYQIYRAIFEESRKLFDDVWWGAGLKTASFIPNLRIDKLFISLFSVYSYGAVEMQFQYLKGKKPFDNEEKRRELLNRLNDALGMKLDNMERRPSVRIAVFNKPGVLAAFFGVVKWYIDEVRNYYKLLNKDF